MSKPRPDTSWITEQCSRLLYGQCSTRQCLVRGGYNGRGPVDLSIATCEVREIMEYILQLEEEQKTRATSPYLNKPLRTQEKANEDIQDRDKG